MTTSGTAATNKKKFLVVETMAPAALALFAERGDIEFVEFPNTISKADFEALLRQHAPVHGVSLGATAFGERELAASKDIKVVARIGVGYDAVDVPVLTKNDVPLMTTGIANSPSVAEQALFMMLWLAKRAAELDSMVKANRWNDRLGCIPYDVLGRTVLVVGFGRIGSRTVKRCLAMEMRVLVYDPYRAELDIREAGAEPVIDLDAALPQADFVTLHCPKTPETVNLMNAERIARMKPTAYLVNTARGGIVNEAALHAALIGGKLAGAGLDVFESEPPAEDNPLLKLPNVICAPHVAGVTREALDRMSLQAARNMISAVDGKPDREYVVNKEVLG